MTRQTTPRTGFTLVELLVVISIIALLVGILLPAISRARDNAMVGQSKSNIRNVRVASDMYMNDHNGRGWNGCPANLSNGPKGEWTGISAQNALIAWRNRYWTMQDGGLGGKMIIPPGIQPCETTGGRQWFVDLTTCAEVDQVIPYCFGEGLSVSPRGYARQGTYRFPNSRQMAEYMEDKCYNKVFWSPKDRVITRELQYCWDADGSTCATTLNGDLEGEYTVDIPFLMVPSSYSFSPPNMMNSYCYRKPKASESPTDAFTDPMAIPGGFRQNTLAQCKFSSNKTYLMETHWLQNLTTGECGARWGDSTYGYHYPAGDDNASTWSYDGCYPHYFNASWRSSPVAAMCDGSITQISVELAEKHDYVVAGQNGSTGDVASYKGLWHRGVAGDLENGFFIECRSDWAQWSGHVMTTGGMCEGRDILPED